ncbi:acetyltransferase [Sphingobacterium sp.]|uniref:acetyltransferase n=1 Tax=Sphingobacterium sp. TaxID=341027 RepID=UPI002FD896F9
MLDNVVIIGYSGHAYVVIEAALSAGISIGGYCDMTQRSNNPYGLNYHGNEASESFVWRDDVCYFIGIGDNSIRERAANRIINNKGKFINIIHKSACVSDTVEFGNGVFFNANVTVNALVNLGNHCILNTGCIIEHECVIGSFVHIGPGAVLAGNVIVGDRSFIGANSVVKQGIKIGSNVIIGAGAVVIKDVPDGQVVAGNPAKKIK